MNHQQIVVGIGSPPRPLRKGGFAIFLVMSRPPLLAEEKVHALAGHSRIPKTEKGHARSLLVDRAVLHDEFHLMQPGEIPGRIAFDADEICQQTWFDVSDAIVHMENLCIDRRG
jgi:hypothetical protein